MIVKAPWTREQVEALNHYQRSGKFHAFTCGNRAKTFHPFEEEYGDWGALRATSIGWMCPFCLYTQDWAHAFMMAGTTISKSVKREPVLKKPEG
jgi:hypothetical protein